MTTACRMLVAVLLAGAGLLTGAGPAHADDPVMHHVKYTISVQNPIYANIYYIDQEPAIFSDYSHDPYRFTPNVKTDIAPDHPWSFELNEAKPEYWAMVVVNTGPEPGTPQFHCELSVDGAVVVSKDGPRGVLCSIRNW
ncbi:hypothetical protein A5744_06970 [Mycobacterium sp. IS-1264]|nr:hypothetical protein A5744_06970 [Mycobacterium sp. IS-1264]